MVWMHRQAITSPHVADVHPSTLVYLERTYGWAIRMVQVALGLGIVLGLNEGESMGKCSLVCVYGVHGLALDAMRYDVVVHGKQTHVG